MNWFWVALVGISFVLAAVFLAVREHRWIRQADVRPGVVVEIVERRDSDGATYAPHVRFETRHGSAREFTSDVSSSRPAFRVGDSVLVGHELTSEDARILTFAQRFGVASILASLGMGLLFLTACFVLGNAWFLARHPSPHNVTRPDSAGGM
jgi:hypothetical protein